MSGDTSNPATSPPLSLVVDNTISNPSAVRMYTGGGGGGSPVDADTKDYIDAKADAVKAQNDARFAEVMSALGGLKADMSAQAEVARARFEATATEIATTRDAALAAKSSADNVKWNIIVTGLTVAAILLGMWTIWAQAVEMTAGILAAPALEATSTTEPVPAEPSP